MWDDPYQSFDFLYIQVKIVFEFIIIADCATLKGKQQYSDMTVFIYYL